MTNTQAIMVSKLVKEQNYTGAENVLAVLKKTELKETIEALPTKDLLAIVRNHDSSKPTVIHSVITPEQFARILALEHAIIGDHTSNIATHSEGMISAIIMREDESDGHTGADFLTAALENDDSLSEVIKYLMPQGKIEDSDDCRLHLTRLAEIQEYLVKSRGEDREECPDSEWEKILSIAKDAPEHAILTLMDAITVQKSVISRSYAKFKDMERESDEYDSDKIDAEELTEGNMRSASKADGQKMPPTEESAL